MTIAIIAAAMLAGGIIGYLTRMAEENKHDH